MFQAAGLKVLHRVGTNLYLLRQLPFKMHKMISFPENLKKSHVSSVNFGRVGLPRTQVFFLFGLTAKFGQNPASGLDVLTTFNNHKISP